MKTIKFNKRYCKLDSTSDVETADLIQIFTINSSDLSEHFKRYDTRHENSDGKECFTHIESGNYLLLVFEKLNNTIYTTLRKNNPENIQYYANSIGETFRIVVEVTNEQE